VIQPKFKLLTCGLKFGTLPTCVMRINRHH